MRQAKCPNGVMRCESLAGAVLEDHLFCCLTDTCVQQQQQKQHQNWPVERPTIRYPGHLQSARILIYRSYTNT